VSYSSEVLADSPLVYWKLAEASGTTMVDSSGNSRAGTYTASPTLGQTGPLAGSSDTAALFNGTTQYGQIASASWMNVSTEFTIEAWFKTTATAGTIFGRGANPANYRIGVTGGKAFAGSTLSGGAEATAIGTTTVNDGNWHYVCARWTGSTLILEVDGVQENTVARATLSTSPNPLRVAQRNSDSFFAGTIGQCALYGTNIGPTRMAAHYSAGLSGGPTTITGGLSTETDSASAGSVTAGARVSGGLPVETDVALAGSIQTGQIVALGQAVETDSASAGTVSVVVVGGLATETDSAFKVSLSLTLGQAVETDTALGGVFVSGIIIPLGLAVETDEALAGGGDEDYTRSVVSNLVGGRSRSGVGVGTWEPAVAPVPDSLVPAVAYDVAHAFPAPVILDGQPMVDVTSEKVARLRHRIVVNGYDITYLRNIPTPPLDYDLIQPLMYGPGTLTLPQVYAAFEEPGVGELAWLVPGATVKQQRVDADGNVVATDYKGRIVAFDVTGRSLTVQLGGEASGPAALMHHPVPLWRKTRDLGRRVWLAMHQIGIRLEPFLGPDTGIDINAFGGMDQLEYLNRLCALGVTKAGDQWTIMPDADGVWRLALKDTTTIHGTVYADGRYVEADLRRDISEEPNRVFGTGVTPDGVRVLGGVYPGLKQGDPAPYPMADGSSFAEGTTDADTDTGDGVTVMINRLQVFGYLSRRDSPGGFDADVTEAIEALQDDAGLAQSGHMNEASWDALFDLNATGFSLGWSHVEPLAQAPETRRWRRSGSGAIIGSNPDYDRRVMKVDREVDFGVGFKRHQMVRWARRERVAAADNWVGTVTFNTGALVAGDHTPGDPITVMPALDLRPGMNLRLPHFAGGITVHVSAAEVRGGTVTASVDTRARDTIAVWEVIARNRDSRRDPARAWLRDHRSSGLVKDAIGEFSEVGGLLGDDVSVRGGRWTVFEVVAGQAGTIARLRLRTNPDAEFACAVFAQKITPERLDALVPNPLADRSDWTTEATRNKLDDHALVYAAGDPDQPLGYHPSSKTDGGALTGLWDDEAGFGYATFALPVLYVAVYADRDTVIPAGRVMWPQLEPGA